MNAQTMNQMFSVILLDCLTKLNAMQLNRAEYQGRLNEMLLERTGQTIDLTEIETLIGNRND